MLWLAWYKNIATDLITADNKHFQPSLAVSSAVIACDRKLAPPDPNTSATVFTSCNFLALTIEFKLHLPIILWMMFCLHLQLQMLQFNSCLWINTFEFDGCQQLPVSVHADDYDGEAAPWRVPFWLFLVGRFHPIICSCHSSEQYQLMRESPRSSTHWTPLLPKI